MKRIIFIIFCFTISVVSAQRPASARACLAVLGTGAIIGTGIFTEDGRGTLDIFVNITRGLTPGNHGLHVHQFGDLSNRCLAAGPHFNPRSQNHGSITSPVRHAGDLGNIFASADGSALIQLSGVGLSLDATNSNSIVGRTLIVHEVADDLGLGGDAESLLTGNARGRFACGIIGLT